MLFSYFANFQANYASKGMPDQTLAVTWNWQNKLRTHEKTFRKYCKKRFENVA